MRSQVQRDSELHAAGLGTRRTAWGRRRACALIVSAAVCAACLGQSCVSPAVLPNSVDAQGTSPKPTATDSSADAPTNPVEPPDFIAGYVLGIGLALDFAVASADGNLDAATYTWDFGDAGAGDGMQVRHVYDRPGTYVVRLCATLDGGNVLCREREIQVIVPKTIAGE